MEFRGNRWYKCDLHIHTPESKCFDDQEVTPEQWVQECIEKGLDVVAVTDHNSGNHIDKIMEAAKDTSLKVFPGVEITCDTSKIHLLVIFDRNKRTSDINEFLNYCGMQRNNFADQNATTGKNENIFTVAEKALERGAIVIPAHIDEYNGLSEASHQSMKEFLKKTEITSVQVVNKEIYDSVMPNEEVLSLLEQRYSEINTDLLKRWTNAVKLAKDNKKAILTFSDNPNGPGESKHGLWGIGKRYTWVKMEEEVNIESLRQALLMPEQKIRNDFNGNNIPYEKPDLLIKGLRIKNTILNPSNELEIKFSSQLSTIIGGRGTGKSSIQRIIRGLLTDNSDLKDFENLYEEQENFFKVSNTNGAGDETGVLKEDTKIDLFIQRHNQSFKISFCNFKESNFNKKIYKLNESGQFEKTDESILSLFPVEIYSQKQVYNIATKPNALREKIDQSIDSFESHQEQLGEYKSNYFLKKSKIKDLKNSIGKKSKLVIEKNDIEERLRLYNENGYKELITRRKKLEKDKLMLEQVISDLEEKTNLIKQFITDFQYINYKKFDFTEQSTDELNSILSVNQLKFTSALAKLDVVKKEIGETKESLVEKLAESNWNNQYNQVNDEYTSLQEKLSPDQLYELENIEELSRQLVSKDKELKEIKEKEEYIETLKSELKEIFDSYLELKKDFTESRRSFLKEVLSESPNIKIDVKPFRDKTNFQNEFRRIIQRSNAYTNDINKLTSFVFQGLVESKIKELREMIYVIRDSGESNEFFSKNFNKLILGLNDEQISEIDLLYPEDKIEVNYKANGASSYKSISNASAGQKTSAILTFLLSYGKEPLLLDQPEDDLDNQLIYDLIVERLSESKNQRQVIVISHNANIPVNGDAEWVTALDSESPEIKVLSEGSIENNEINAAICNIMEGGKEAFSLRAKRYNFE